jgi:hypothetical protein
MVTVLPGEDSQEAQPIP